MVQFHPDLLDSRVAPGISGFDAAEIPDVGADFPDRERWLSTHFLHTLFGPTYKGKWLHWSINLMARAQAHLMFYSQAREATYDFLGASKPHNPDARRYYIAVALWEGAFLNAQVFVDLFRKSTSQNAFESGDCSDDERAYEIANDIKHFGELVSRSDFLPANPIPLWLTNAGFHTANRCLSYGELAAISREIGKTAAMLQNPRTPQVSP